MTVPRFFLSVFCLLFLLAACGRQTEPKGDPAPETNVPAAADPAAPATADAPAFVPVSPGTDAGYYLFRTPDTGTTRSLLCYIDYESAQMLPLCAVPGCAHADESCTAYALGQIGSPGGLFAVGDTLYLLQQYADRDSSCLLTAAGLDGSDPHTLLEFDPAWYQLLTPCTDGEMLYLLGCSVDETAMAARTDLLCVDLATGSCTVAAQLTDGAAYQLCGGDGQTLVLDRAEGTAHARQSFDTTTGELGPAEPYEPEPPAEAPLSRQTADGDTVPIRPLAETGGDFLVQYDTKETLTAEGLDYRPQYALISQTDYYAGIPNWRPISGF